MKLEFMKGIDIKYSEEDIKDLGKKLNWKGNGTKDDPLIISSEEALPHKFGLLSSKLYIKIKDCNFDHVVLEECQNVIIEGCSFNQLRVVFSKHNIIENSNLSSLFLAFSYYNYFKKCTITKTSNIMSKENVFQDCILEDKARKGIKRDIMIPSHLFGFLFLGVIGAIISLIFFPFFNLISPEQSLISLIIAFLLLIIIYVIYSKFKKEKKRHSENIIQNERLPDMNHRKNSSNLSKKNNNKRG